MKSKKPLVYDLNDKVLCGYKNKCSSVGKAFAWHQRDRGSVPPSIRPKSLKSIR